VTIERIRPKFVELVPETLASGILYISLEHGSMAHLCACGCGSEVVLPLTPVDWRLTYDGEDISLSPSVGSWSLACRSHYVLDRGRVRWAGDWTEKEIEAGRKHDQRRKDQQYGTATTPGEPPKADPIAPAVAPVRPVFVPSRGGLMGWLSRLIGR
jgi:hypothetical protein